MKYIITTTYEAEGQQTLRALSEGEVKVGSDFEMLVRNQEAQEGAIERRIYKSLPLQ